MTSNIPGFVVDGSDDTQLGLAFQWLTTAADENGGGAIAIPTLRQIDHLSRVLGAPAAAGLRQHRQIETPAGSPVELHLGSKRSWGTIDGPLLAIWVDDVYLNNLMNLRPTAVCVAYWLRSNVERWIDAHGPTNLASGQPETTAEISDPVLLAALSGLDGVVNRSTGITHPSDREQAINIFRLLRDKRVGFEPRAIRAWATRAGWSGHDADELADVAAKIQQGRALRGSSWPADHRRRVWERWAGGHV